MPPMVTEADPRSSAGSLSTFLPCDLWITVRFADNAKRKKNKSAWDKFETKILSMAFMGGPEQTVPRTDIVLRHWSDRQDTMLLGLKIPEAGGDDRSVLMGPVAGPSCPNAKSFRSLWGESTCELRRLDDGSIRESVAISNPWGGAYFVAAVVSHLARVHAAETIAECSPLSFDDDFLPRNSRSDLRQVRSAVDRLSRVLLDNSEPSLPVRRVRGLGAVVHSGYEAKSFATPLTFSANKSKSKSAVATPDGRLKPEAKIAPPLTRAIPLTMDITHKKRLSPDMFALLKTAYLINVKKFLDGRSDVAGTMLRAGKVYVEFSDFLFALDVDPPSSTGQDAEDRDDFFCVLFCLFLQQPFIRTKPTLEIILVNIDIINWKQLETMKTQNKLLCTSLQLDHHVKQLSSVRGTSTQRLAGCVLSRASLDFSKGTLITFSPLKFIDLFQTVSSCSDARTRRGRGRCRHLPGLRLRERPLLEPAPWRARAARHGRVRRSQVLRLPLLPRLQLVPRDHPGRRVDDDDA